MSKRKSYTFEELLKEKNAEELFLYNFNRMYRAIKYMKKSTLDFYDKRCVDAANLLYYIDKYIDTMQSEKQKKEFQKKCQYIIDFCKICID